MPKVAHKGDFISRRNGLEKSFFTDDSMRPLRIALDASVQGRNKATSISDDDEQVVKITQYKLADVRVKCVKSFGKI